MHSLFDGKIKNKLVRMRSHIFGRPVNRDAVFGVCLHETHIKFKHERKLTLPMSGWKCGSLSLFVIYITNSLLEIGLKMFKIQESNWAKIIKNHDHKAV